MSLPPQPELCIYCQLRPPTPSEHFLAAGLGRFGVRSRSRTLICDECNLELGKLYNALFRKGPYSFLRRLLPWKIGRTKAHADDGAGYAMPLLKDERSPFPLLAEVRQGGVSGGLASQITFRRKGTDHLVPWRVPAHVASSDDLRDAIRRAGHADDEPGHASWTPGSPFPEWLKGVYPATTCEPWQPPWKLGDRIVVRGAWNLDDMQRKALAMLGFHMFLLCYAARGDEAPFRPIRDVILGRAESTSVLTAVGGGTGVAVPYALEDGLPDRTKHLFLCGSTASGKIVMHLRLFDGPHGVANPWWMVELGHGVPIRSQAFALVYFGDGPREVSSEWRDGEVVAMGGEGTRLVLPARPLGSSDPSNAPSAPVGQ